MRPSFLSSLHACVWLMPRQCRQMARELMWLAVVSVAMSLLVGGLLLHLVTLADAAAPGSATGTKVQTLPATRVVLAAATWLESAGKDEPTRGALSGVSVWVNCQSDPSRCEEGHALVEAVDAQHATSADLGLVWMQWRNERWEVSAPAQPKYALAAAVVIHAASRKESMAAQYGSFESVSLVREGADKSLSLDRVENLSRQLLMYILFGALVIPSLQVALLGATQVLSSTSQALEKGAFEPFVSAPLPAWVLLLSRSLALGALIFGFSLGLALVVQAFVGFIHPVNLLAFSISMAATGVVACMAALTLATAFYSRILRWIFGYLAGPLPMILFSMVLLMGGVVSWMLDKVLGGESVGAIPLLEWSVIQGLAVATVVLALAGLGVGALIAFGQSPWGQRRPGLRSNRG